MIYTWVKCKTATMKKVNGWEIRELPYTTYGNTDKRYYWKSSVEYPQKTELTKLNYSWAISIDEYTFEFVFERSRLRIEGKLEDYLSQIHFDLYGHEVVLLFDFNGTRVPVLLQSVTERKFMSFLPKKVIAEKCCITTRMVASHYDLENSDVKIANVGIIPYKFERAFKLKKILDFAHRYNIGIDNQLEFITPEDSVIPVLSTVLVGSDLTIDACLKTIMAKLGDMDSLPPVFQLPWNNKYVNTATKETFTSTDKAEVIMKLANL